jgi:hypothetical protein
MEIELRLTRTNGQTQSVRRDISRLSDAYLLCGVVVDVRETAVDGEFVIYIQPEADIAIRKIELITEFDPSGAYVFDAGSFSDSGACVNSADTPVLFSRDFFMAANLNYEDPSKVFTVNLGFTSFEKIFTYFTYVPGRVTAVYNMENRTVPQGSIIRLESIMIDDTLPPVLFLSEAADSIAAKQKLKKAPPKIFGWTSELAESAGKNDPSQFRKAQDMIATLVGNCCGGMEGKTEKVLISDAAWQKKGPYSCDYTVDQDVLPGGFGAAAEDCEGKEVRFGIGYSPALIEGSSDRFKDYNYRLYDDRNYVPSFGDTFPLNLASQDVVSDMSNFMKTAAEQGVKTVKLNDLEALLCRPGGGHTPVVYQRDYSVALLRKFLKQLKRSAGDDALIIGSGPAGECAGIVDAFMSGGSVPARGEDSGDGALWNSVKKAVLNVFYRSVYNKKLFRICAGPVAFGDGRGTSLSEDEAEVLAAGLAFSGSAMMLGEAPEELTGTVSKLIKGLMPPCGIAAYPLDFWEYPYCSHFVAPVPDNSVRTEIHLLFNFEDFSEDRVLRTSAPCIFTDMMRGGMLASGRNFLNLTMKPHSVKAILVKRMPEHAAFLWTDDNIYRGTVNTSDLFFSDTLIITSDAPSGTDFNIFVPYGNSSDIFVNEHKLTLKHVKVTELEEGSIYTYTV